MEKVNVSTLKSQLSGVLRAVKRGKEFLVMDRSDPVAHLGQIPAPLGTFGDNKSLLHELYERGVLDLPQDSKLTVSWLRKNLIRSKKSAVQALLQEREEADF